MTNNFFFGPDAQVRFAIESLKDQQAKGRFSMQSNIVDGIHISTDADAGVKGRYSSEPGKFLSLQMGPTATREAKWQALHVGLGACDLSKASVLGIVARSSAPAAVHTKICLRSGRGSGFSDHFLSKTMISFSEETTHLDLLPLDSASDVPATAPWRDVILFFPRGAFEVDLVDLRVFIV